MRRIVIIGCPGSGKTRLARALGDKLDLTVVHLDRLWWKKDREHVSREEFDTRLDNALKLDSWIIDGNYSRTMEARLQKCDTIIYLDYSRWVCLWGLCQRILKGRKGLRKDMPDGWTDRIDWDLVRYVWNYNRNNRVLNNTWIAKSKHAKAIVLKSRREASRFLDNV